MSLAWLLKSFKSISNFLSLVIPHVDPKRLTGAPEWPPYSTHWPDVQEGLGIPSRGTGMCRGQEVGGSKTRGVGVGLGQKLESQLEYRIHMGNNKR